MILRSVSTRSSVLFECVVPKCVARSISSSAGHDPSQKRIHHITPRRPPPVLPSTLFESIQATVTQSLRTKADISDQQADVLNSTLMQIRHASAEEDVVSLLQLWNRVKAANLVPFLGQHLDRISSVFVKLLVPSPYDSRVWDTSTRDLVEEIVVAAALAHETDGLLACMDYYLRRGDPDSVISLYSRCSAIMNNKQAWSDVVEEEEGRSPEDEHTLFGPDQSMSTVPHIPGRIYMILSVTTAYAMRDGFRDALATCQETDVRFHHYTTQEYLDRLEFDSALRDKVSSYVRRLDLARLVSRPPSLSRQITNLGESNAIIPLKKLYDGIIEAIEGPDAFIATNESSVSPEKPVAITNVGWTSFLTAFLKCSRKDIAAQLWDDVARLGLHHDTTMWNALISGQATSFSDATKTFELMKSQKVEPDALTYRGLIYSLFNGRRPNLAMDRFHRFQTEIQDAPIESVLAVYNTVLNGLLVTNRVDAAFSLLQKMEIEGPKPDVVSYNTFLGHHARQNDLRGLGKIMNKMAESDTAGDVFSFSTILSALLKLGRQDAADTVFRLMGKQGVKANTATYTAIINHQMRECDEPHLNGALSLLAQMEAQPTVPPNEVTYTAILAGIHRGGWLSKQKEEDFTRSILDRMKRRNVKLNTRGYNILLKACLSSDRIDRALVYYDKMKRDKVPFFQQTWYILLYGLIGMKEWGIAKEVVADMGLYEVRPHGALQGLVQRVLKSSGNGNGSSSRKSGRKP